MERLCVFCKYLQHESGGHGEYAEADKFRCRIGGWDYVSDSAHKAIYDWWRERIYGSPGEVDCDNLEVFRILIKTAESCESYSPPEE